MITIKDIETNEAMISDVAEKLLFSLSDNVVNCNLQNVEELKAEQKDLKRKLSYYAVRDKKEKNIDFARGRLIGIVQLLEQLITVSEKNIAEFKNIDEIFVLINTVSHGNEIIQLLSPNRGMQHKELCKNLGITAGTLTGITDKLCEMNLIYFTKTGKFKFYYLSDLGQRFKYENIHKSETYALSKLEAELESEKRKNRELQLLIYKNERKLMNSIRIKYVVINPAEINRNDNKTNKDFKPLYESRKSNNAFDFSGQARLWTYYKSLKYGV